MKINTYPKIQLYDTCRCCGQEPYCGYIERFFRCKQECQLYPAAVIPGRQSAIPCQADGYSHLALNGGLERTKAEYESLLSKAGFRLEKIIPSKSVMPVIEAGRCRLTS